VQNKLQKKLMSEYKPAKNMNADYKREEEREIGGIELLLYRASPTLSLP
jgi:hypothetical protein